MSAAHGVSSLRSGQLSVRSHKSGFQQHSLASAEAGFLGPLMASLPNSKGSAGSPCDEEEEEIELEAGIRRGLPEASRNRLSCVAPLQASCITQRSFFALPAPGLRTYLGWGRESVAYADSCAVHQARWVHMKDKDNKSIEYIFRLPR